MATEKAARVRTVCRATTISRWVDKHGNKGAPGAADVPEGFLLGHGAFEYYGKLLDIERCADGTTKVTIHYGTVLGSMEVIYPPDTIEIETVYGERPEWVWARP